MDGVWPEEGGRGNSYTDFLRTYILVYKDPEKCYLITEELLRDESWEQNCITKGIYSSKPLRIQSRSRPYNMVHKQLPYATSQSTLSG